VRILLDECVPRKLASEFMGHSVETVRSMGWRGIKNGELLQRVVDSGFEVFITVDKNLEYQQKLSVLPLSIIVLESFRNTLAELRPLILVCLAALSDCRPGTVYRFSSPE
jgi:predicted nuclease of predicted toxin-antitoxin system